VETETGRVEEERVLVFWVDNLVGMVTLGEEYDNTNAPDQVEVHHVVQERHITVDNKNVGKLSLYFFGKGKDNHPGADGKQRIH